MTESEILKDNVLRLASHHKLTCNNPECDISITLVGLLLEKAGIKLTKAELSELV